MKKFLYCYFYLTAFLCCAKQHVSRSLVEADSLILENKNDSAYNLLIGIKERKLKTAEDRAYYYLLLTRTSLLTGNIAPPDSYIDYSINYFKQKKDFFKLADAYYYKACQMRLSEKDREAMLYYKKAEYCSKKSNDLLQQFKIAEGIAFLNGLYGNYHLKLNYSKRALEIARCLMDSSKIAYSYYWVSNAFTQLEIKDSSSHYAKMIIPFVNNIEKKDMHHFFTTIGNGYKSVDNSKAKYYYKLALEQKDISGALEGLADIYFEEENYVEAYNLWKRALLVNDEALKDNIIYNILEYDIIHGNTDNVLSKVNDILDIKDSIQRNLSNETIDELQFRFDKEVETYELDRKLDRSIIAIMIMIVIVWIAVTYVTIKRSRFKQLLAKKQIQIDNYNTQIRRLEKFGASYREEIDTLRSKIVDLAETQSQRMNRGLFLYNHVKENKTVTEWSKDDYKMFIDYYDAIDHETVKGHRELYPKLTPRSLVFLLLYDMGKNDEDIKSIMALSPEGLRSIRFRVYHAKRK